jgi:hypothetical protein
LLQQSIALFLEMSHRCLKREDAVSLMHFYVSHAVSTRIIRCPSTAMAIYFIYLNI